MEKAGEAMSRLAVLSNNPMQREFDHPMLPVLLYKNCHKNCNCILIFCDNFYTIKPATLDGQTPFALDYWTKLRVLTLLLLLSPWWYNLLGLRNKIGRAE